MACKDTPIRFARAADADAKTVATGYYNAAIHRGSQAVPECLRWVLQGCNGA
jgi:spermidine synthase